MVDKVKEYGYDKVGFVLDRGYFSKDNIRYMEENKYSFIIMAKGCKKLVSELVREHRNTFETDRDCAIRTYRVYGKTILSPLYEDDTANRYFHLYFNPSKQAAERELLEQRLDSLKLNLDKHKGTDATFGKAYHDYFILEKYEVGLVLHGTEVKSLRMGKCSIKESFIRVEDGEMYIYGMHISPYEKGNIFNKDPLRVRKLLLHKKEILKISGKMKEQGITVVPLQVYFSGSLVKMEIGLAKGKKLYDKRDDIAKKDQKREAQREFKVRNL